MSNELPSVISNQPRLPATVIFGDGADKRSIRIIRLPDGTIEVWGTDADGVEQSIGIQLDAPMETYIVEVSVPCVYSVGIRARSRDAVKAWLRNESEVVEDVLRRVDGDGYSICFEDFQLHSIVEESCITVDHTIK